MLPWDYIFFKKYYLFFRIPKYFPRLYNLDAYNMIKSNQLFTRYVFLVADGIVKFKLPFFFFKFSNQTMIRYL